MVRRDFISPGGQLADMRINVDGDKGGILKPIQLAPYRFLGDRRFISAVRGVVGRKVEGGGRAAAAGENVGV